jgi:hypothetical protein
MEALGMAAAGDVPVCEAGDYTAVTGSLRNGVSMEGRVAASLVLIGGAAISQ